MPGEIECPSCGRRIDPSVDYGSVGGMCEPEGTTRSDKPPSRCPFCGDEL